MDIQKILIAQPQPGVNSPYAELQTKHGVQIDFIPFIRVVEQPVNDFRQQRINFLDYTAVVFTSRMAIDAYFHLSEAFRTSIPETMKYFCMTEAIALYLQKYIVYRKRKIFYGKGNISSLIESIGTKHKGERFLLALADTYKPEITNAFDKAKLNYAKAIVLSTVFCDLSELDPRAYDMLVFYSPSDVHSLKHNFPGFEQGSLRFATFGPATAAALKEAGFSACVEAPTPQAPSITQALTLYIENQ